MDRRNFMRLGLTGGIAAVTLPSLAVASSKSAGTTQKMAGGVFYTKENPGRWGKKVGGHLPGIEMTKSKGFAKLKVQTKHGMDPHKHYITKHIILDKDFNFIAENLFDPTKDKVAVSNFEIKNYSGTVYVLSHCNKHDTWMNTIEV